VDEATEAVVAQGGMPNGDDAERALNVITKYVDNHGTPFMLMSVSKKLLDLPPELFQELGNIRRCLVAFLALMRMHEAKQEHGINEKPEH
jgi:hypothetical protein